MLKHLSAFVLALSLITGCGEEPKDDVHIPVPVTMNGGWRGQVTVFAVGKTGLREQVLQYTTTATIEQNGNYATVTNLCPGQGDPVDHAFIGAAFLYWEGTSRCDGALGRLTYLSVAYLQLTPQEDGTVIGYAKGGVSLGNPTEAGEMWASMTFAPTESPSP